MALSAFALVLFARDWATFSALDLAIAFAVVVGILYFAYTVVARRPRLALTKSGIELQYLFMKPDVWEWKNVGPFSLEVAGFYQYPRYFACAFTDEHHDLLVTHNSEEQPDKETADVVIPMAMLSSLLGYDSSCRFVHIFNTWRDVYGRPDIYVNPIGAEERYQHLQAQIIKGHRVSLAKNIGMFVLCALLFAAYVWARNILDMYGV